MHGKNQGRKSMPHYTRLITIDGLPAPESYRTARLASYEQI
jgi:hypothetical protein